MEVILKFKTRTSDQLSLGWQQMAKKVDWMTIHLMHDHVNELATGKPGLHWAEFILQNYLIEKRNILGRNLRMAAIAPGVGDIECSLLNDFSWPVSSIDLYEYDDALRIELRSKFSNLGVEATVHQYDLNSTKLPSLEYDLVFVSHSLHHATDLKFALESIKGSMQDDGLFIGIDYFGPTRFQVDNDTWGILEKLDLMLPDSLKINLDPSLTNQVSMAIKRLSWDEIVSYDISEAPHSSDLRNLLFSQFHVVLKRPMGGTLLRWLFNNRAGNFDEANEEHLSILRLLSFVEASFIENKIIQSDDLMFVLRKPLSLLE
jgi:SAM-dependent methyltransferase